MGYCGRNGLEVLGPVYCRFIEGGEGFVKFGHYQVVFAISVDVYKVKVRGVCFSFVSSGAVAVDPGAGGVRF